jgi:hypothetical protein
MRKWPRAFSAGVRTTGSPGILKTGGGVAREGFTGGGGGERSNEHAEKASTKKERNPPCTALVQCLIDMEETYHVEKCTVNAVS